MFLQSGVHGLSAFETLLTSHGIMGILVSLGALVIILVVLWILAIPYRLSIELAGRLIGVNPDVGNFGALILFALYYIWRPLGIVAFVLKFHEQVGVLKSLALAFLSIITLEVLRALFDAIAEFVFKFAGSFV